MLHRGAVLQRPHALVHMRVCTAAREWSPSASPAILWCPGSHADRWRRSGAGGDVQRGSGAVAGGAGRARGGARAHRRRRRRLAHVLGGAAALLQAAVRLAEDADGGGRGEGGPRGRHGRRHRPPEHRCAHRCAHRSRASRPPRPSPCSSSVLCGRRRWGALRAGWCKGCAVFSETQVEAALCSSIETSVAFNGSPLSVGGSLGGAHMRVCSITHDSVLPGRAPCATCHTSTIRVSRHE